MLIKMTGARLLTLVLLFNVTSLPTVGASPLLHSTTTSLPPDSPDSTDSLTGSGDHLSDPNQDSNHASTTQPPAVSLDSSFPLRRCQYEYKHDVRNELFEVDGENLPLLANYFFVAKHESRCYLSRHDLESKLDANSTDEVIAIFALVCLNPDGADVTFFEDEEAEELEALSHGGGQGTGRHPPGERNASSSYRWYEHVISYFQGSNCRINLKAVDIIANMSDLRVLSVLGHRAWNFSELQERPELCRSLRNVVALSMIGDWSTETYLHHLAVCKDYLHNVVEMDFTNDSLTSFPEIMYTTVPNLRALEISNNRLTSPVDFPWPSGFAALPRNLSRTYQFNLHYNFANSFDMEPHLFRRVFLMNGNRITKLTHFRFHSDFQYISVQRNGLKDIATGVFDHVPSLQFLSLAYNELEFLPEDLFHRLVNLKRLDLQGNKLVTLPTNVFWNVRKLERLNVEQNRLELLQEGLFGRLEELTEVKLKNNSIVEVKKEAFTTLSVKLKKLELQNNPLKTFPVIVLLLRGLVDTNLENTDIEVLDFVKIARQTSVSILGESIKNPTTGTYVDVKENPEFQKIISLRNSKLRSMVVYNDTRETVPMFMLIIKYFTIQLEGSRLACDCHILNVTRQLQKWQMDGTLTGEEDCLQSWNCIWPSELSGKPVATLKDSDTYCPLDEVDISRNTSCPEECTCYLRTKVNTVIVDCQNGGLTALPSKVPKDTRELWLQNNTIQSLEKHPYLTHLTSLKLTSNNVKDLPIDVLLQMPDLTILHLDDNWLTGLGAEFAQLGQLREVRLAGNPFRCDCTTLWMKSWILGHQAITKDWTAIKCTTQEDDGQVFTAVPDNQFICKVSATLSELAVPIAIPLSFGFLFLVLGVMAFIQRRRLKVFLYIHTGYHPFDRDPPDDGALYDVTVLCDVKACVWVLRHVIESLEEGGRYKVFFYSRDAYLGFTITENVRHCVKNSKRMVLVLGKEWARNEVLVTAVREALAKCHHDMPHFLTVLLHDYSAKDIDNKELRQYVHRGRYISTEDKHFTKKLLYEMPHIKASRKSKQERKSAGEQPKKDQGEGPQPIAMYDIVAVAENEQNRKVEGDGNILGLDGVYIRQVSHHEVDVDLRQSGVKQDHLQNIQRQDSQHHDGDSDSDDDNNANDDAAERDENVIVHPAGLQNQLSVESRNSLQPRRIFVWYADNDLPFTLKNVVEPLEKRGHVCILEDRDFPLGAAIQENIVNAVESSTRCIFVLSNRTPDNDWFNFAFHVAFDRHLQTPDHRVALVSREEVDVSKFVEEVQQVIRTSAILNEGDPWFWKRLKTFVHFEPVELG